VSRDQKINSMSLIKRLYLDFISDLRLKLIIAVCAMVIIAACNALQAWLLKPALDDIFLKKDMSKLLTIPIIIISVTLIKSVASYFQNYYLRFVNQKITVSMQEKLFAHLIYMDLDYISKFQSGKIISKFSNDINIIKNSLDSCVVNIAKEFFTVVFLLAVMLSLNLQLSFITLIILPIITFPIIKIGRKMKKLSRHTQNEIDDFVSSLDETFVAFRTVKSFMAEKSEILITKQYLSRVLDLYKKTIKAESISSPLVELVTGLAIALTIYLGGIQAINGTTTPGTFFAFIAIVISAYKPIKNLSAFNSVLQIGVSAVERFYDLIDIRPQIKSPSKPRKVNFTDCTVEFRNISFAYDEKQIFDELSIKIPPKKMVAIVGSSGCGKSTLLNLICRFYDTDSGNVLIDGHDIKDVSLHYLREHIGIVTQEVLLFNKSIRDNICYGSVKHTEQEIIAASKAADAFDFINNLPEKFDTIIGPRGLSLSGGQRQKLSLARALLKNYPLLLLDEATSSLDNISERKIQKSLRFYRKGKATIIVAHRVSSIVNADYIVFLKDGKLVGCDTHKNLLKRNSDYFELFSTAIKSEA
jgi:subfamily B ATP-binding cassette protein MsbA